VQVQLLQPVGTDLRLPPMSAIGTKRTCKTAMLNVRFEGNNLHDADVTRGQLWTLSGHRYSICKMERIAAAGTEWASAASNLLCPGTEP
jgi:hypothetical protein